MELTRVEGYLKMINDLSRHKPESTREKFRTSLLQYLIENPKKYRLTNKDIEQLKQEL